MAYIWYLDHEIYGDTKEGRGDDPSPPDSPESTRPIQTGRTEPLTHLPPRDSWCCRGRSGGGLPCPLMIYVVMNAPYLSWNVCTLVLEI